MKLLVNIDVPDVPAAIAFYEAALGLRLARMLDDDMAELAGGPVPIYLLGQPEGTATGKASSESRRYARHWTPVHLDFVVEDLEAAAARAERAGARRETDCVEWRGSRCITFSDPFGHGFCLIAFDGETYVEAPGPPRAGMLRP